MVRKCYTQSFCWIPVLNHSIVNWKASAEIQNEADNGLKNSKYTLAMARTAAPHSASSQFFINAADNAFLDYPGQDGWGYCVFGPMNRQCSNSQKEISYVQVVFLCIMSAPQYHLTPWRMAHAGRQVHWPKIIPWLYFEYTSHVPSPIKHLENEVWCGHLAFFLCVCVRCNYLRCVCTFSDLCSEDESLTHTEAPQAMACLHPLRMPSLW